MDENMSEVERVDSPVERQRQESAKRVKTDFELEESSSSSNNSNGNEQCASTSSDSGLAVSVGEEENHQSVVPCAEQSKSSDRESAEGEMSEEREGENDNGDDDDGDDLDSVLSSLEDYNSRHSTSSENTVIHSTDTEAEEGHVQEVLTKEKPKHTWFMVQEVVNRQFGYRSNKSNPSLFQHRCYGSLRNVQKLELMYKLEDHDGCVNSLNFSPDGNLLASGSDDLKVAIWDWRIGKSLIKVDTSHRKNIFQTKFMDLKGPDLHLATCGRDGQVYYMQIGQEGVRESRQLGLHRGPSHKLTVLKDQPHILLSCGEDGLVYNYDLRRSQPNRIVQVKDEDGREIALYSIHSHPLNGDHFCVAGRDSIVRVYDQRYSRPLGEYCAFKESDTNFLRGFHITCAVYNHDGSEIMASYNDSDIYVFEKGAQFGQYAHRYSGHRNGATIKGVSFFGPRSEFVMSGSDCGHVFFWERKTESVAQFLLADDNGVVNCLEPHPQLPFLATSGLDWDVKIWVPSCEEGPALKDLASIVRDNKRAGWNSHLDRSEHQSLPQVLWMLWQRLRASRRERNLPDDVVDFSILNMESSGSDSSSGSWRSHEEEGTAGGDGESGDADDDTPGCATS